MRSVDSRLYPGMRHEILNEAGSQAVYDDVLGLAGNAGGGGMIAVVAGVVRREGRVLLCQRPEGKRLGLLWEFPGGKVEAGETPEAALERELREELELRRARAACWTCCAWTTAMAAICLLLFYESEIVPGRAANGGVPRA